MFEKGQYRKFRLEGDVIHWKERTFPVSAVAHLRFQRVLTTQKLNFQSIGESHSSHLTITLDSGEEIFLSFDEATVFLGWNSDKSEDLKNLAALYGYLAKVTFQKRIAPYIRQVEQTGYFEFAGCQFFPHNRIICRGQEFLLSQCTFLRGAWYVEPRRKETGFFAKVKREIVTSFIRSPHINTQTDTDVILSLLKHYFGLQWGV